MSEPTITNATAVAIDKDISLVEKGALAAAEALIFADEPALAAPGLKQLVELVLGWAGGYFAKALDSGATFAVIDNQVGKEEATLTQVIAALQAAEKSGNLDEIKKEMAAYQAAQSALVHDDGSASV